MKTVLITGASKGIGAATAIIFAEKGYNVVINYNNSFGAAKVLTSSLSERGFSVFPIRADVSKTNEVKDMVNKVIEKFGKIDVLVNNAGISQQKLFTDITDDDWNNIINTNLKGAFNVSREVIPYMIKNHSGKIVNVSSMWGVSGASCEVHYSAAKAGIIGLTKSLAKELAPSGINVNCVAPGLTETQMNDNIGMDALADFVNEIPLGRMAAPYEIGKVIYFLSEEDSDYITGQVINVDGGINI